jgi:hypothetical protein
MTEINDGEPQRRPIEASLAHALAWGVPARILDADAPPPTTDDDSSRTPLLSHIRRWFRREG